MTIKTVQKDGQEFFEVRVAKRGYKNKSIRVQKFKTNIKTRAEAIKIERQLTEEAIREAHDLENQGCTWETLTDKWEHALLIGKGSENNVTRWTAEDYMSNIRAYTQMFMHRPADQLTRSDVKEALYAIDKLGRSYRTKERLITAINGAFRYGVDTGLLDRKCVSPAYGVRLSREQSKKPEILTLDEIRRFLEAAKTYAHPWYPVWAMAFLTGMRSGELHALLWTDVDWESRFITVSKSFNKRAGGIVKETKAGYWREVPINDELFALLKELRKTANGRKHVLPRFWEWDQGNTALITRKFLEGIGITSVKFHALRACFATQLIRNGVPPGVVMKICGWKDLKTMQRYIRLAGIEIQGATDSLNFITPSQAMGKVVELIRRN